MAGQISVRMERGIFRSVSNSGTILAEMRNIDDRFDASYQTSSVYSRGIQLFPLLSDHLFFQEVEKYTFRIFYPRVTIQGERRMPKDYYNEQLEGKRTRLYVNVRAFIGGRL